MDKTPKHKPVEMEKVLDSIQNEINFRFGNAITESEKQGNAPLVKVLRQNKAEYDKVTEILRSVYRKK